MNDEATHPLFRLDSGHLHYFSVLGRALYTAQHFEMNCRAISNLIRIKMDVEVFGSSILDDPTFLENLSRFWNKKTLNNHITLIKNAGISSQEIDEIFNNAREARNRLAHNITIGADDRIDSELDQRLDEIRILVRSIASADKIAALLICQTNNDPLPSKAFFSSYEDKIVEWVTKDTFS